MSAHDIFSPRPVVSGDLFELVTGVAAIVLAICGLADIAPPILAATASIILGAAFVGDGIRLLTRYARLSPPADGPRLWSEALGANIASAVFITGVLATILGVLALCGVNSAVLTPFASVALGTGLVLRSNALWQLHLRVESASNLRGSKGVTPGGREDDLGDMTGVQALAGLAATILAALAVAGNQYDLTLNLVALLVLSSAFVLTASVTASVITTLARPLSRG
jgi:hypothetical protein